MTQQVHASSTVPMTLVEIRQKLLDRDIKTKFNSPDETEKLVLLLEKMDFFLPSIFLELSTFTTILPFAYLYFLNRYFQIKA
jgi:hypothetical protein